MSFCSREALATHGALPGTGVRGRAYVFLPVPKRFWRSDELNDSWASPQEIAAVRAGRRAGVVTRLYNPMTPAEAQILVRAAEAGPDEAVASVVSAFERRWLVEAAPSPLLAVCTHGTRDRCCAKWGYSAYRSARALYEAGASPFQALECSHLGGDRFAATGVFFPSGSMYAYLDQADLSRLSAAEAAGDLLSQGYRGRVFEPELVQVVRAGLAAEHRLTDASAPLHLEPLESAEEARRVLARAGPRAFEVTLHRREVTFFGSCEQLAGGRASRARRWTYAGATVAGAEAEPA